MRPFTAGCSRDIKREEHKNRYILRSSSGKSRPEGCFANESIQIDCHCTCCPLAGRPRFEQCCKVNINKDVAQFARNTWCCHNEYTSKSKERVSRDHISPENTRKPSIKLERAQGCCEVPKYQQWNSSSYQKGNRYQTLPATIKRQSTSPNRMSDYCEMSKYQQKGFSTRQMIERFETPPENTKRESRNLMRRPGCHNLPKYHQRNLSQCHQASNLYTPGKDCYESKQLTQKHLQCCKIAKTCEENKSPPNHNSEQPTPKFRQRSFSDCRKTIQENFKPTALIPKYQQHNFSNLMRIPGCCDISKYHQRNLSQCHQASNLYAPGKDCHESKKLTQEHPQRNLPQCCKTAKTCEESKSSPPKYQQQDFPKHYETFQQHNLSGYCKKSYKKPEEFSDRKIIKNRQVCPYCQNEFDVCYEEQCQLNDKCRTLDRKYDYKDCNTTVHSCCKGYKVNNKDEYQNTHNQGWKIKGHRNEYQPTQLKKNY